MPDISKAIVIKINPVKFYFSNKFGTVCIECIKTVDLYETLFCSMCI